jgi:nitroreductase
METWDAIRARRNVRQYSGEPIARKHLERILEAGRRAPSSQNWQPWHFVVVTGRDQLIELAKAWEPVICPYRLAVLRRCLAGRWADLGSFGRTYMTG